MYRAIDANINRAAEGLRVIEDVHRFIYDDGQVSKEARNLRHRVRKEIAYKNLLGSRSVSRDLGRETSKATSIDKKEDLNQVVISNFKRVEEALRVIEELLKSSGDYEVGKKYEEIRYEVYKLEESTYKKSNPIDTDIYAILSYDQANKRSNIDICKELIAGGIEVIQYRDKTRDIRTCLEELKVIREITSKNGVKLIVNDNISLALGVKADGIHLGQEDMPISEARTIVGDMFIGISTNNIQEAKEAKALGADYIGIGPVFPTKTKDNLRSEVDPNTLLWIKENLDLPYVAIGGINEENISDLLAYGVDTFAMISELTRAEDIGLKIKNLRRKIKER